MSSGWKKMLVGKPLETASLMHQRLNNVMALAVFSSDALSSAAYATEEILIVLLAAGAVAMNLSMPIAICTALLFAIVVMSYRQTIAAYPGGGGSYIVAKENLGVMPGLIAAAALLTDYILTVAVSVASGVAAITSAVPSLFPHRVELCVVAVVLVMMANLRGVRESGALFSAPTYFFLVTFVILIVVGLYKVFFMPGSMPEMAFHSVKVTQSLTLFLILRAFSSGCAALTGTEAISNGVMAFRSPESVNARKTLTAMAVFCIFNLLGITFLAHKLHVMPMEAVTVVSQIAEHVFGRGTMYFAIQISTCLILLLGANTSFQDFPRLSSLLARAGFMPRQMSNLGDRLVFANGIIILGAVSAVLLIIFQGSTTRLIPLYAIGVFLSFTLSQTGMVVHWLRLREPGWKYSIVFNALGATATAVVTVVVAVTKFPLGAWIVTILIPILVYAFWSISVHYKNVAVELRVNDNNPDTTALENRVFMPISGVTTVSVYALRFCRSISSNVTGLYINVNQESTEKISAQIERMNLPVHVQVLESPYRSITEPLIAFIDAESKANPDEIITLVVPEFMPRRKWHYFLHNQTAMVIYAALRGRENVVITSIRKRLTK